MLLWTRLRAPASLPPCNGEQRRQNRPAPEDELDAKTHGFETTNTSVGPLAVKTPLKRGGKRCKTLRTVVAILGRDVDACHLFYGTHIVSGCAGNEWPPFAVGLWRNCMVSGDACFISPAGGKDQNKNTRFVWECLAYLLSTLETEFHGWWLTGLDIIQNTKYKTHKTLPVM